MLAALRQLAARLGGSTETQALAEVLEVALDGYFEALADESPTRVVGILNVTPDSFSDGSRYLDAAAALARAREMVAEGADWIDVGGESTRPGSEPVPAEEELRRVLPVFEALAGTPNVTLSIDTTKAVVAERCLAAGATIVNDVSGLSFDPRMAEVVAASGAGLVLMHIRGTPRTMQVDPVYDDVVADTLRFLRRQVAVAVAAGVSPSGIWIDPGFGFGKTVAHNLELLRRLREYTSAGLPIFIGTSRKSALGRLLARGDEPIPDPEQRLEATAATISIAIAHGARAVRVHDVRAMARVARVTDAILGRGGR
jgi:dihydropteroate synthase